MFRIFKSRPEPIVKPQLDIAGLLIQSRSNARYLRAHINVLNGNIEWLKVTSSRAARKKIERLIEVRDWMLCKLEEEESNILIFEKSFAPIVGI